MCRAGPGCCAAVQHIIQADGHEASTARDLRVGVDHTSCPVGVVAPKRLRTGALDGVVSQPFPKRGAVLRDELHRGHLGRHLHTPGYARATPHATPCAPPPPCAALHASPRPAPRRAHPPRMSAQSCENERSAALRQKISSRVRAPAFAGATTGVRGGRNALGAPLEALQRPHATSYHL